MNNKFETEYQQLNAEQRLAVDSIYGPVLLLAGPGAGKTQVISMRIANIIKQTDTAPSSILALTFTDNAAKNMSQRLVQLIGPEGNKIKISTFHGFCNDIINQYPEIFVFAKQLKPIDELTRLQIIENIIAETNLSLLKLVSSPTFYISSIRSAISNLKKEGISPEEYSQLVAKEEKYAVDFAEVNPKTGKLTTKWQNYQKQIAKNSELATIYQKYAAELNEKGLYDYEDMINFVTNTLKTNSELLAELQERYLYTLVDEYQDTNGSQNELLMQLNSYDDSPNLFVVGDEDQSIYSFQGANLKNLLEFKQKYPSAEVITTKLNYRSRQDILDAGSKIISKNPDRFENYYPEVKKSLISFLPSEKFVSRYPIEEAALIYSKPIVLVRNQTNYQEAAWIADKIREITSTGVKPSEIAVIYRNHSDAADLIKSLTLKGIPFTSDTGGDVLNLPVIKKCINLLQFLNNPSLSANLLEILHYPVWKIDSTDIYKILKIYSGKYRKEDLYEVIADTEYLIESGVKNVEPINTMLTTINSLSEILREQIITESFPIILEKTGIISQLELSQDIAKAESLLTFFNFLKRRSDLSPNYGTEQLLSDIASMRENGVQLKAEKAGASAEGVRLLTAHAAKGLEFAHVFILKSINGTWGNKSVNDKLKLLNLHPINTDQGPADTKDEKTNAANEERRLFYVALTRAKLQLYLTYAEKYYEQNSDRAKDSNLSEFIQELGDEMIEYLDNSSQAVDVISLLKPVGPPPRPDIDLTSGGGHDDHLGLSETDRGYFQEILENFRLSFSSLQNFADCGWKFIYGNLLGVPQPRSNSALLGSAIHAALEQLAKRRQSGQTLEEIGADVIVDIACRHIGRQFISWQEKQDLQAEAEKLLTDYISDLITNPDKSTAVEVEYNISPYTKFAGQRLSGKIDLVERAETNDLEAKQIVRIVDYKNTVPKSAAAMKGLTKSAGYEKNYFKQLNFYVIAAQNDPGFPYEVKETAIQFLKPTPAGKYKREVFGIESESIAELKQEITSTIDLLSAAKFNPACNLEDCWACQMKENAES